MKLPITEILKCVRAEQDAERALAELISIGRRKAKKSPVWDQLPAIDVNADVERAGKWLRLQLKDKLITGVYLGLDTLNESGRNGKNVEIGFTRNCDPDATDIEWVYNLEHYGKDHLIQGLKQLHEAWFDINDESNEHYVFESICDFTLFLGYSGVVLAAALAARQLQAHATYVWGFHDGDLFRLARWTPAGFQRVARL